MRIAVLVGLFCNLIALHSAYARESGINASSDGRYVLIQKDVGDARWAINLDLQNNYRLTGNIFSGSAAPIFVDCEVVQIEHNGSDRIADWTFSYRCSLTQSCDAQICPEWTSAGPDVVLPGSFFAVTEPEPEPTPIRTSTPVRTSTPIRTSVPQPTAQSTPVVTSSLAGMIGTWDFSFTISSTFSFTYRMQQIVSANGKTGLATLNEFGERQFVFRVQDLTPGSALPYEFVMISNERGIVCNYYVWNRDGNSVSGVNFPLLTSNGECDIDTLSSAYTMFGVRTASTAVATGMESFGAPLTDVIASRAEHMLSEVTLTAGDAEVNFGELDAVGVAVMDELKARRELPAK